MSAIEAALTSTDKMYKHKKHMKIFEENHERILSNQGVIKKNENITNVKLQDEHEDQSICQFPQKHVDSPGSDKNWTVKNSSDNHYAYAEHQQASQSQIDHMEIYRQQIIDQNIIVNESGVQKYNQGKFNINLKIYNIF